MTDEDIKHPEDGNAENTVTGTIFDDVFRTIAEKLPFLLIALINEVFHTDYRSDQPFRQLRNEHYEKFGKIITDSIIEIGGHLYHIECQSERDGNMALRMFEYDVAIAMEHSSMTEDGVIQIEFPRSCVLYIRNHRDLPRSHEAKVLFADGQEVTYRVPVLSAQDYTVDSIFQKDMLALLPYYILRYERFLKSKSSDPKKTAKLLSDFEKIQRELELRQDKEGHESLFIDMVGLIKQIVDHVIPDDSPMKERIGDIMGGTVLKLESEKCREEGMERGRAEGRMEGMERGRMEGRMEGMERGRIEGRAEGRADIVKNMIRKAMPDASIAELSGLPISEISALKAQMQQQSLGG